MSILQSSENWQNRRRKSWQRPSRKDDCPICFLPMPGRILACVSLPDTTILSVPIRDFAHAHAVLLGSNDTLFFHVAGRAFVKDAYNRSKSHDPLWGCGLAGFTDESITSESLRHSLEIGNKLSSIGRLQHQLGDIILCFFWQNYLNKVLLVEINRHNFDSIQ